MAHLKEGDEVTVYDARHGYNIDSDGNTIIYKLIEPTFNQSQDINENGDLVPKGDKQRGYRLQAPDGKIIWQAEQYVHLHKKGNNI